MANSTILGLEGVEANSYKGGTHMPQVITSVWGKVNSHSVRVTWELCLASSSALERCHLHSE